MAMVVIRILNYSSLDYLVLG